MATPTAKPRLFQKLSPDSAQRIELLGRRIGYIKGRMVFAEGQPASESFLLLEGRLTMTVGEGEERCAVGDVWPGEFAGERAFFDGSGLHQVTISAAANSRGIMLDREAIQILEDDPALTIIQEHMVHTLLRRLQGADLAVRKGWQQVRAAQSGEVVSDEPVPQNLVEGIRAMINKLLGGAA